MLTSLPLNVERLETAPDGALTNTESSAAETTWRTSGIVGLGTAAASSSAAIYSTIGRLLNFSFSIKSKWRSHAGKESTDKHCDTKEDVRQLLPFTN